MIADLHFHSIYSDGTLTPKELIEKAHSLGLKYIALTDHDALLGVEELEREALKYDIKVIVGVELTTKFNSESIHILGYFKSLDDIGFDFKNYLSYMMEKRESRLEEMTKNMNKLYGFNIDFNDIKVKHPYMLERPHLAEEIMKKTGITDNKIIFDKYLSESSPGYVHASKITPSEGIAMIHMAGGIAVLAHPYCYKKNNPVDIINLGVDGVEVYYSPSNPKDYHKYVKICNKKNLLMTGGSDFHKEIDFKHQDLGTSIIEEKEVLKLIEKLNSLK
mgnify:CR=1 FL=1